MTRTRRLRVTFDYQNTETPQTCKMEVLEFLMGADAAPTVLRTEKPPVSHYKRILRFVLSRFRVPLSHVKRINENDGRLQADIDASDSVTDPYAWA